MLLFFYFYIIKNIYSALYSVDPQLKVLIIVVFEMQAILVGCLTYLPINFTYLLYWLNHNLHISLWTPLIHLSPSTQYFIFNSIDQTYLPPILEQCNYNLCLPWINNDLCYPSEAHTHGFRNRTQYPPCWVTFPSSLSIGFYKKKDSTHLFSLFSSWKKLWEVFGDLLYWF